MRCLWGLHTMRSMPSSRPSMSTHSPWPGHKWLDQYSCLCRCSVLFCQSESVTTVDSKGVLAGNRACQHLDFMILRDKYRCP